MVTRHQREVELTTKAQSVLDKVLVEESSEQRARVLKLVLDMGINPEEEFFALSLALQHLQTLMLDSPQELRSLFAEFQGELDAWTSGNLQVLKALGQESSNLADLAESSEQLGANLEGLTEICNDLVVRLSGASQSLDGLVEEWQQVRGVSLPQIGELKTSVEKQENQLADLTRAVSDLRRDFGRPAFLRRTTWKGAVVAVCVVYCIVFSGVSLVTLMMYLTDRPLMREVFEKVE